ncbi:MAG: MerR family transcriptional regulator, partial [Solirubrobacterales bacterium]
MNPDSENAPRLRIGELSRRTGVRADTLRAWERRYELLRPERSDGGFRLYGRDDESRVRAMKALIDSGVSASEAARLAVSSPAGTGLSPAHGAPPSQS